MKATKKYLIRPNLFRQGEDTVILHLRFTQEKFDQIGRAWVFPLDLTFYSYQDENKMWKTWQTSNILLDSSYGLSRLDELANVIALIYKKIQYVRKDPKSIIEALVGRSFKLVYQDVRTGENVETLTQLDCRRYKARVISKENGNFMWIGEALAPSEDEAKKIIAKQLIDTDQYDLLNQWVSEGAKVHERNYNSPSDNEFWYLNIGDMVEFPDRENSITAQVEKEESNA